MMVCVLERERKQKRYVEASVLSTSSFDAFSAPLEILKIILSGYCWYKRSTYSIHKDPGIPSIYNRCMYYVVVTAVLYTKG